MTSGMLMADTRHVQATYDPDAGVWWAESEDLPGLVSEAPTLDALVDRVMAVAGISLQFSVTRQVEPA